MAKSNKEKKKARRKVKRKQVKAGKFREAARERGEFFQSEAHYHMEMGNIPKAVAAIKKAVKLSPGNEEIIDSVIQIGIQAGDEAVVLDGMRRQYRAGAMDPVNRYPFLFRLVESDAYDEGLALAEETLELFPQFKLTGKRKLKQEIVALRNFCKQKIAKRLADEVISKIAKHKSERSAREKSAKHDAARIFRENSVFSKAKGRRASSPVKKNAPGPAPGNGPAPSRPEESTPHIGKNRAPAVNSTPQVEIPEIPDIPVSLSLDMASFTEPLQGEKRHGIEQYELALDSYRIRFQESYDNLICLGGLNNVRSFWYQEETARKVLKRFRGRALLSDEVGLGKTIEALIIFSEYVQRGMVKSALILTPTPLVSQWQEEMKVKFGFHIPSTDDPEFRSGDEAFWQAPFILASINQAKSKKNFGLVTAREYDLVIVDEAHHLKNRTTLNWKLVNTLKKRFILLLTATPVENNLMELYNLITLLKPGQLKTATAFRSEFMTKGDPTDPRNRARLKDLLGEVMIRNTRALAGIKIPPRFAETVRITPSKSEQALYGRLQEVVTDLNETGSGKEKLLLKNLLTQAGSSPRAVELALDRMLEKGSVLNRQEAELRALKNLCRTTVDTPKNKMLLKLLKSSREKVIIFVKYMGTLDHLSEFLDWNNIPFAVFHGRMDNARKDREILSFREDKDILVTTEVGGEGRNLQFCNRMVNYDLPWNPMKIEQRIGRIHRIGQENEVRIYNFCASGSIEDHILDILDRKINMFEMVIGEIDMIMGRVRGEKEFSDLVYDIWASAATEEERAKSFANLGTRLKRARTGYEKTRILDDKLFGENYEL